MPLTAEQTVRCRSEYVRELREFLADAACKYTKAQLDAAIAAADQWCSDNAASYNTALPPTFRTTATNAEKALLLAVVALRRFGR